MASFVFENTVEGIIGGDVAVLGQFRYQVAIMNNLDLNCGGVIIAEQFILTAAHCVVDTNLSFINEVWTVITGVVDIDAKSSYKIQVNIEKIYVPQNFTPCEKFNGNPDTALNADIAVLKLEQSLNLNGIVPLQKLNLPEPSDVSLTYEKSYPIITGFGCNSVITKGWINPKKDFCSKYTYLKYAITDIIPNNKCRLIFGNIINDKLICAQFKQRNLQQPEGIWHGDSGGPLVLNGMTVIGILSSSTNDPEKIGDPAIYTKVASYLSFIQKAKNDEKSTEIRTASYKIVKILTNKVKILVET